MNLTEDQIPSLPTPLESTLNRMSVSLDRRIRLLTGERFWVLRLGFFAVLLSLLTHTPVRSMYRDVGRTWSGRVCGFQAAHPFTPIDVLAFRPADAPEYDALHLEKMALRITIPLIGHVLGTGAYSWLMLNIAAGLIFYPLFARLAYKLLDDRLTASYLTLALSVSWTGGHFFNDVGFGDGVAWLFLLVAISFGVVPIIFLAVLAAGFTDERAVIASSAVLLFWFWDARKIPPGSTPPRSSMHGLLPALAVVAAWIVYFVVRFLLARCIGLHTGSTGLFDLNTVWYHASQTIPFNCLAVFELLWLWLLLGVISQWAQHGRWGAACYLGVFAVSAALAMTLYDIRRSLAYNFVLFPLVWQIPGLSPKHNLLLARACFVLGCLLVVPFDTVIRYLYHGAPPPGLF